MRLLPPPPRDPRRLVDASTSDDAGVYRIDRKRALVQTVDFFTPVVDDPFAFGQIAAANALSDVYAMGGRPLTAMNLLGLPLDAVPAKVAAEILRGGASILRKAKCALVGGHSIRNPEPLYGLAVTGIVAPGRMITNAAARPGDLLVLTKPLGIGIVTTALKRGVVSKELLARAVRLMIHLNGVGAELGERGWVRAGTDITGFGLLGHLRSMCAASGVGAEIEAGCVPALSRAVRGLIERGYVPGGSRQNLEFAAGFTAFDAQVTEPHRVLLADAQTSGGLLLCVPERRLRSVQALLARFRSPCVAVVGRIVRSAKPAIRVSP